MVTAAKSYLRPGYIGDSDDSSKFPGQTHASKQVLLEKPVMYYSVTNAV